VYGLVHERFIYIEETFLQIQSAKGFLYFIWKQLKHCPTNFDESLVAKENFKILIYRIWIVESKNLNIEKFTEQMKHFQFLYLHFIKKIKK
jgi:hypothetical protein